jgi:hypothetical protein
MAPLALVMAFSLLDVAGLVINAPTPIVLFAMGFLALLYGLLLSGSAHWRVILYEDGIEVLGWFSARQLKLSEILGRRMGGTDPRNVHGSFFIIVPTDKAARELTLPPFLHVDKDFFSWMDRIPRVKN